jgi:hypothetical protein
VARRTTISDDNLLRARIAGTASRLARYGMRAEDEPAAVAELRELAGHRPDLLAEQAGLALSFGDAPPDGELYRVRADLCIKAGADVAQIPKWIEIGRGRAAAAAAVPYTGAMHRK